ncbi:hypothetical protein GHT06_013740 [Daphnia sinensis]|uniref:Cyclin-dependent kinase inhibitor domain-containing protein n=1 Tax=Daphnia sinensis TaxID=1820382 RepID=A0AAD5LBP4_9CRUS|nr:hypothetical protein GHT06_013740 [Daphnia sinensis]
MPIVQVPSYGFHSAVGGHPAPSHMAVRGPVSPVRRRLFVSDDEEDVQDNRLAVERQLAQIQREQTIQWNFDFANGVPLQGRYLWQPTPLLDRPSHPLPPPAGIKRPIDNQADPAAPRCKQMKPDLHDAINNNHRCVNQKKITDFMKNQKLSESKRRDGGSLPSSSNGVDH